MHRDKHDFYLRVLDLQHARGIDPIEHRHRDVQNHDIRLQLRDGIQQGTSVSDRADQLALIVQEAPKSLQHQGMIVGQQDAGQRHIATLTRGTYIDTVVPFPGIDSISQVP